MNNHGLHDEEIFKRLNEELYKWVEERQHLVRNSVMASYLMNFGFRLAYLCAVDYNEANKLIQSVLDGSWKDHLKALDNENNEEGI